jgi:hypothetical protein
MFDSSQAFLLKLSQEDVSLFGLVFFLERAEELRKKGRKEPRV